VEGFGEAGCSLGASPRSSWRAGYPLGAPPNLPAMDDRVSRVNHVTGIIARHCRRCRRGTICSVSIVRPIAPPRIIESHSEAMSGKMREEAAMSVPSAAAETGVRGDSAPTDDTRLRGRPLALARGAWLILALLTLATVVATIPIEYTRLQQICLSPDCEHPHLTPDSLRELQALGLSSSFFTAYFIIAEVVFA